jgi:hypothetical protein
MLADQAREVDWNNAMATMPISMLSPVMRTAMALAIRTDVIVMKNCDGYA